MRDDSNRDLDYVLLVIAALAVSLIVATVVAVWPVK